MKVRFASAAGLFCNAPGLHPVAAPGDTLLQEGQRFVHLCMTPFNPNSCAAPHPHLDAAGWKSAHRGNAPRIHSSGPSRTTFRHIQGCKNFAHLGRQIAQLRIAGIQHPFPSSARPSGGNPAEMMMAQGQTRNQVHRVGETRCQSADRRATLRWMRRPGYRTGFLGRD